MFKAMYYMLSPFNLKGRLMSWRNRPPRVVEMVETGRYAK